MRFCRPQSDGIGKTKPNRAGSHVRIRDAYRPDYQPLHLDLIGILGNKLANRIQDNKSLATGCSSDHRCLVADT